MLWCVLFIFAACGTTQAEEWQVNTVPLPTTSITDSRIIGGSPVSIERYPFIVQVLYNSQLLCGGSLLTSRHVLTAAHCFFNDQGIQVGPRRFSVRVGSSNANSGGKVHSVSTIVVHERYNRIPRDNDIAIMLLNRHVKWSDRVGTARIPLADAVVPKNATVVHIGWGTTSTTNPATSPILNGVSVYKIDHAVCRERYTMLEQLRGEPYPVTSNMICAGVLDVGGRDACQGDSGGPLLYRNVVVGVTSWGYGCALPLFPGVSARVASYTNWITNTVSQLRGGSRVESASALLLLVSVSAAYCARLSQF
ncbi:trypsin, alkaline C-like [Manduca sexta]|uniref:Peptidase S1 domain-containing protein n=1 Tax=Manduca sexta TaxID=7130 RepID=A0A922CJJ5_MANSE|nr:trypsin, alkaline C-like [Manduca sexta]KAG6449239.1 hypothetical protein O3G_MSEX005945 [Manduca sexta]KAG6449240.1 hypothetical protein O3G_MSEX005945 [Manduca sexta]